MQVCFKYKRRIYYPNGVRNAEFSIKAGSFVIPTPSFLMA
jgi:hypothetical protein